MMQLVMTGEELELYIPLPYIEAELFQRVQFVITGEQSIFNIPAP